MSTNLTRNPGPSRSTDAVDPPEAFTPVGELNVEGESRRRVVRHALIIFLAALLVRLLFFSVRAMDMPAAWMRSGPFGQAEMGNIAVNLAAGRGFSSPFGPGSTPTAWLCPLIPLIWAAVIKILGSANGHTALIVGYLGTVPSAAFVVVYWLIVRHLLRGNPVLRRTAFLAAAIFCIWPEALYELDFPNLWYFPWEEFATALVVLLGMKWIDRPSLKTVVPLGMAGGILALINVTPVPIFAVALVVPAFRNPAGRSRSLGLGAVGATLALLLCLPWLVRNAVVFHTFVPTRSNGGFQFWEGNNSLGCVREAADSQHPAIQPAILQRYQTMGEIDFSRQAFHLAMAYIRLHPREAMVRTLDRTYVFWLTDVLDRWKWDAKTESWWEQGRPAIVKTLSATVPAWGLIALLIWALLSKRLANLPYKEIFLSILVFLPFPYYFTLAENEYSQILRSWLLMLAILAVSGAFRRLPAEAEMGSPAYNLLGSSRRRTIP